MELCEAAIIESIKSSEKQYYTNSTTVGVKRKSDQLDDSIEYPIHGRDSKVIYSPSEVRKSTEVDTSLQTHTENVVPITLDEFVPLSKPSLPHSVLRTLNSNKTDEKSVSCLRSLTKESRADDVSNSRADETASPVELSKEISIRQSQKQEENTVLKGMPERRNSPEFNFSQSVPRLVYSATSAFDENCTKGCSWFPTEDKIIVAAEDARYRIFDLESVPEDDLSPCLTVKETEMIYDFCWTGSIPSTFLSTGRYQPIHLWNGTSGELLSTYRCINQLDELTHAFSVCMSACGGQFLAGLKNQIRRFDLSRPGRDCQTISTGNKSGYGQTGIISCISCDGDRRMLAAGSYSRTVGLFSEDGSLINLLSGHTGGVTQVAFSPDSNRVFSGARKDDQIICWDLRNQSLPLFILKRDASTNQRFQFSLCQNYILSGGSDGSLRVWDYGGEIRSGYLLHPDSLPGLSVHPNRALVATTSGQRHVAPIDACEQLAENSLKIWDFS